VVKLVDTHVSGACVARHVGSSPTFGTGQFHVQRSLGVVDNLKLALVVYYVYVIVSPTHNFTYVGTTDNVDRRIHQHNAGFGKSTRRYRPFELIHTEAFPTREDARKREKYLKSAAGREFLSILKG